MYGYIYETTNLINGKKYIGQHRASKFDNSYHGSGKLLIKAFKKYGIKNFKTIMLEECKNEKELNDKEIYYISKFKASISDNYYNVSIGGENWMTLVHHTNEAKRKISESGKGRIVSEETRKKISDAGKKRFQNPEERRKISETQKRTRKGEIHSKEWNRHVSEALKGKIWICNKDESKYIYPSDLDSYLQQGWQRGRKYKESI